MDSFKEYIQSPCPKSEEEVVGKWDVVLFTGNYNPITKDEHDRINQFVQNVIRGVDYKHLFSETVDVGLIFDEDDDNMLKAEIGKTLTNDEKNFITTKLFGLRGFPISYRRLKWLTFPVEGKEKLPINSHLSQKKLKDDILTMYHPALDQLKRNFENVNILIVVNPEENSYMSDLDGVMTNFEDDTIKIGFMSWKHVAHDEVKELGGIPVTGDMVKALIMLDHDRPEPEELKSFAYMYGLSKYVEHIRALHFRVNGKSISKRLCLYSQLWLFMMTMSLISKIITVSSWKY